MRRKLNMYNHYIDSVEYQYIGIKFWHWESQKKQYGTDIGNIVKSIFCMVYDIFYWYEQRIARRKHQKTLVIHKYYTLRHNTVQSIQLSCT